MVSHLDILKKFTGKEAGIFIDEANVFYSQKTLGWHIHWQKFLEYLSEFVEIKIAKYYMGEPTAKEAFEKNVLIKHRLETEGFEVITKPLKKIYLDKDKKRFIHKCNFDVEITIDVIRNLANLDLVIVGTSDSDFIALQRDVVSHDKGFIFCCFDHNAPWEIRRVYHTFFEDIKDHIIYKKENPENKFGVE